MFDAKRAQSLKEAGMTRAAEHRAEHLKFARLTAIKIASQREDRLCHADLVQKELLEHQISLGNAAGSIFRGDEWEWTGRWIASNRISNHKRYVRVWVLK